MRMSDTVDTETMKVSEAADPASSPKDNTTKAEVLDQSQSSRDEHGSNKNNVQVKNCDVWRLQGKEDLYSPSSNISVT